ncbi:MAG: 2-amino-4-hydroxy-6-hydroxymethyldihydropteridine diphosphokinase [Treponemataceae bacterium]
MEKIVLGLGSNVGNSMEYLRKAVKSLSQLVQNPQVSSVYKTKPQDYLAQADFLNLVFVGDYQGSPKSLLACTQKIERENGRNRFKEVAKGPRTLDIDILLFGEHIVNTQKLIIPHPAMKKRQFVLIPLLEILPDYAEPISNIPYSFFQKALEEQGVEKLCSLW